MVEQVLELPTQIRCRAAILALGVMVAFFTFVAQAPAAEPQTLWTNPADQMIGTGAGQLHLAEGVATNAATGHVYVADAENARISEFTAWGQFVRAWGWGVADGAAAFQSCGPEASPPTATCQAGLRGNGAGQFKSLLGGIAVDPAGNVYVGDMENHRVQKFTATGEFLLSFGSEGSGLGQFQTQRYGTYIAVGPSGNVFVGDVGRVQEFDSAGTPIGEVALPGSLAGKAVESLDIDSAGNFWLIAQGDPLVRKLSPTGSTLLTVAAEQPLQLTVDDRDNVYVAVVTLQDRFEVIENEGQKETRKYGPGLWVEVVEFDSAGQPLIPLESGFAVTKGYPPERLIIVGLGTNVVTASGAVEVYITMANATSRSLISAYGPPPDKWPAPAVAPVVSGQFAVSVAPAEATLRAQINPRFWADTTYYVEYGTGKCSEGGCTSQVPVSPGKALGAGVISKAITTEDVVLPGLSPSTTYHFRFVAQSSGGGPVRGVGGVVGTDGSEATFVTPAAEEPADTNCPNQAFRTGASAFLPDCRAYEMVSPVDKEGGSVQVLLDNFSSPAGLNISAAAGSRFTYSSYRAFADPKAGAYVSQYLADRGAGGWLTRAISPPRGTTKLEPLTTFALEFRAFTEDLCNSALVQFGETPLATGGVPGYSNIYRARNCGSAAYEALTTVEPPTVKIKQFKPDVMGLSADGSCVVFNADDQLTPEANPGVSGDGTPFQLYESCNDNLGELRLISILPNGTTAKESSAVGTTNFQLPVHYQSVKNAFSDDGTRVYWTNRLAKSPLGPGRIYLRFNSTEPQSAVNGSNKCTEAAKACTIAVSGLVAGGENARFISARPDGSAALFTVEGKLYEFDFATRKSTLVASKVSGVMGASEDLSRIYLVSEEVLDSGATAGKPNLYLFSGEPGSGSFAYVAGLPASDATPITDTGVPSPVNLLPIEHTAHLSPDGGRLVFTSTGSLTGYDNTDANSGKPDTEVFSYDAVADRLECISCNPTGARPSGRFTTVGELEFQAAAFVPGSTTQLYSQRVLSADGSRVFFNSIDPLLPRDANEKMDVYQWTAPGKNGCEPTSPSYSSPNGGCLALISAGQSDQSDAEFLDASADGTDVFFTTDRSLLAQDPGQLDVYDARAGGGLPPPPGPAPSCEGESCQAPPAPPATLVPASGTAGPGNPKPKKAKCPKGKHQIKKKGKSRCAKNAGKSKSKSRRAHR